MMAQGITGAGMGIILFKDGKVLLGKRNEDPEKASSALHGEGTWTLPGGKLHFHESLEEGAKREAKEETDINVKKVEAIIANLVREAHYITIGLLCKEFIGEVKTMGPEEITEWKWFNLNELPNPIFLPSEKLLKNFKENKFYKY